MARARRQDIHVGESAVAESIDTFLAKATSAHIVSALRAALNTRVPVHAWNGFLSQTWTVQSTELYAGLSIVEQTLIVFSAGMRHLRLHSYCQR